MPAIPGRARRWLLPLVAGGADHPLPGRLEFFVRIVIRFATVSAVAAAAAAATAARSPEPARSSGGPARPSGASASGAAPTTTATPAPGASRSDVRASLDAVERTYDIERYLGIRSASVVGLSPDGGTIAYLTSTTGSNQIWTVSGSSVEPITFFGERVSSASWSPRGDWIAFAKDKGGDENYQIYLVSPDGAKLRALTADPTVRHNLGPWSRDGRWLAYASNERNRRYFDVYVLDIDTMERRRIVEQDALFNPGPFSSDGRRMIVIRQNGSLDSDLFVVPTAPSPDASALVHVTPHEDVAAFRPIGWSSDDRAVIVVSDQGREFAALGRIDLETKAISWETRDRWDVTQAVLSDDGRLLAAAVNEDGYERLALIDAATFESRPAPAVPAGSIGGLAFSRDSRSIALGLGGAARNGDVWLADLAARTVRRVTRSSAGGIPESSFVEPKLVRYRSFDGLEIPAFFYLPGPGRASGGPLPCIVAPHGGPESQTMARFNATIQYFVSRGYAVLAPNVRGSTGYGRAWTHLDDVRKREDSVRDLAAAVPWLTATGTIDPKRIAVMGGSYGGYMTLAAITLHPDLWAAAVDSYGIANFRSFFAKTASYRVVTRASEYGDPVADAEFLDSISPLHRVDRIRAPLLVLQGANDPRVPREEAEQIVEAVRKRGGAVEYVLFPEEGHGWTKLADQITALRATSEFLDRYVGVSRDTEQARGRSAR